MATVYVLPRRTAIEETLALSVSDSAARTVHALTAVDRLEVSDIREYRAGDSLKSIHWKLSSKSEEFVVKDYNTGTSDQTVVFCDIAPHFPDREPHRDAATDAPEQTGENSKKRGGKACAGRQRLPVVLSGTPKLQIRTPFPMSSWLSACRNARQRLNS